MKVKIEVEIDTVEDRAELDELIEQLKNLRDMIANGEDDYDD